MTGAQRQLRALFFTRFANAFGLITLTTLLPKFVTELGAEGLVLGMFATGLTLAQAVAVVPISWAGDRFDMRTILLAGVGLLGVVAVVFPHVGSSYAFIGVRMVQGLATTAAGVLGLALIGQLARKRARGNTIGASNSWRFAGGIAGTFAAGVLYDRFGFDVPFAVLAAVALAAFVVLWLWVDPDETRVEGFAMPDLALNRRLLTITSFRAQYAVAVTLVRTWVPIFAGVTAARGGLAFTGFALSIVVATEQFTNMLAQPYTGRLSDRFGRARFVFAGGLCYGLVAVVVPFTPAIGDALGLPATYAVLGTLSPAFLPLVALNGLLGLADSVREPASMALFADEGAGEGVASSFGVRDLVWRPGAVLAPLAGGWLMSTVGVEWVFFAGAGAAFSGVLVFVAVLTYQHGRGALVEW